MWFVLEAKLEPILVVFIAITVSVYGHSIVVLNSTNSSIQDKWQVNPGHRTMSTNPVDSRTVLDIPGRLEPI